MNVTKRARVRLRWGIALLIGLAAGIAATPTLGIVAGMLAGWGALSLAILVLTLREIWPMDAAETRDHATMEDPGRRTARLIAVVGSVMSLAAVVVVITQAQHAQGGLAFIYGGIALVSVAASWALINSNYLLHYAREYYEVGAAAAGELAKPQRGIDFNQTEDPCYTDFIYFSVGLGMTYQVADTVVTRNAIRRIVIAQTLLAYLFGAGILAAVINLFAGLR